MEADRAAYSKLAALLEKDALERLAADGQTGPEAEKAARKASYEDARSVLPIACDTRMVMTMNVRSLYNFFSLRCCNRAQWEIRALASEMLRACPQRSAAAVCACRTGLRERRVTGGSDVLREGI